jgi:4-amino-4-deoxy-L-arabinose transferase-like glycosyltransferase
VTVAGERPTDPALGEDDDRYWRLALVVVLVATLVRLVLAGLIPLFPDETYYWEWSRRPAPSYYDHPPGIAAVIAFGTALFGDTRIGVRFGAVLLGPVGSVAGIALTRRLGGGRAALVAALALVVMPMAAAGLSSPPRTLPCSQRSRLRHGP